MKFLHRLADFDCEHLSYFAFLALACYTVNYCSHSRFIIGSSMTPTIRNGAFVTMENICTELERDDIVIFNPPHSTFTTFIKRITGLPGGNRYLS